MPEFDQSLYWKLVPYFCVPMERVHVIVVASGPSWQPLSYIYKIVSADNPVRIDQICESEIKRVLLGTPFSPPTPEAKLAAKEWGPSGVLIAPKNSHSTRTMIRFPESCFFAFFRLFGSRKARAPEGKNGTKRHKH